MLPGVGTPELVVIAVVALLVVGPKDLPIMLRKLGQFTARMRGLANEFRASFDEMARQSELDELRKEVEALREGRFADKAEVESHFQEIEQHIGGYDPSNDPHVGWDGGYVDPTPAAVSVLPDPAAIKEEPELPFDKPVADLPPPLPFETVDVAPEPAPAPQKASA